MPSVKKIYSENNDFQHMEVLKRNRQKRHKHREFFVEGIRSINNILANDWKVNAFIYSREGNLSRWAQMILAESRADLHYELPARLMTKLSDREENSELIAIVRIPKDDLRRIKFKGYPLIVVLDRPANPGNLGTIIRSCDAFNVDGLIITGHAVDLYDPQTIRASVGTLFTSTVIRLQSHRELLNWIEKLKADWKDLQITGSTARTDKCITEVNFKNPTIFLLGNETKGLSENYRNLCDELVKIPIHGSASSLNVACAAAISLYEIDLQRSNKS